MSSGEIFLLALGPAIALAAGLMIYGLAAHDSRQTAQAVEVANRAKGPDSKG